MADRLGRILPDEAERTSENRSGLAGLGHFQRQRDAEVRDFVAAYDDDDDILADLDVDDEDEGGTYGRETYGSDEEDFGSGFEISGGNNDDDYY